MNLNKILFILSLIFILILVFLAQISQPKQISINYLNNLSLKNKEEKISLTGEIQKIDYYQNKISFYLKNSKTEFVIFTNKILNLKQDNSVYLEGKIDFYKNSPQIIVDKIKTK